MLQSNVNEPAIIAVIACWMLLALAMAFRPRGPVGSGGARRDPFSFVGVAIQGIAIAIAWTGRWDVMHADISRAEWVGAIGPSVVALGSLGLFAWATQTMGANWSLMARTRADHALVRTGPFGLMRHPIYVAMAGLMIASAFALGHPLNLVLALPIYAIGTLMRVAIEERLLREAFGSEYEDYAGRVKRFIPGVW